MSKILPVLLFLLCILIAVLLAVTVRGGWPAALAIAIAGAALALAMRVQVFEAGEALRGASGEPQETAALRADLDEARATIDDLVGVVEDLAAKVDNRLASRLPVAMLDDPASSARVETRPPSTENPSPATTEHHAHVPSGSKDGASKKTGDAGALKSLMAQAAGKTGPAPSSDAQIPPVRLVPIFKPALGSPVAFVIEPAKAGDADTATGLLRQAKDVADQLEEADKAIQLFVHVSAQALADPNLHDHLVSLIETDEALRKRLFLMTSQTDLDDAARQSLATFAERGCKFALDEVHDWSINLASLAKAGLAYIAVDGPAMARSAKTQGGDPRRLADALAMHGIELIAAKVEDRSELEAVRTLNPALMMGDGLGAARIMEAQA